MVNVSIELYEYAGGYKRTIILLRGFNPAIIDLIDDFFGGLSYGY